MLNIFDAVSRSCLADPERERLTFLHADGRVDKVTGSQLVSSAQRLAAALVQQGQVGDRVLLAYPAGIDFVAGFLGTIRAGMIPVPVSYPKPRRPLSRYAAVASDSQAKLALTSRSLLASIDASTLSSVAWYCNEDLESRDVANGLPDLHQDVANEIAFLQYTSGSTGDPKGVIVTHENVIANLSAIREGFQIGRLPSDQRVVCSWLPAYHDMGLIGVVLASLVHDGHAVMMAPTSFVQQPFRWLDAMSQYQARITVAPTFGYQWATDQVSDDELQQLDLSKLRVAGCGAEPIFASVLNQFAERFADCGFRSESFYPCYGLAESTLMVTGSNRPNHVVNDDAVIDLPGPTVATVSRQQLRDGSASDPVSKDDSLELVASGIAAEHTRVAIVDESTDKPLGDNRIGEIRVHSPSVAAGYWRDNERSAEVFSGRVNGNDEVYLRTGDLGFMREGLLFVTGRIKDLIIIGGQNHYPQDIERTLLESDESLKKLAGAAFSITVDASERLVIVHEVPRGITDDRCQELMRTIRVAIAQEHELAVQEIVLIRPASLPRTSSGKVRRNECRHLFLEDQLKTVALWKYDDAPDPSIFIDRNEVLADASRESVQSKIQSVLIKWLMQQTGSSAIDANQSFAEMGVDSLAAVELSQQFEAWLQLRVSPVVAWSYPNPEALSHHLTNMLIGSDESSREQQARMGIEDLLSEIQSMDDETAEALLREIDGI